jgi:hypothetical protein
MREEQLAEDQAGHGAVEEKIVPLDGCADRTRDYRPAKLDTVLGFRQRTREDTGYAHSNASLKYFVYRNYKARSGPRNIDE